MIHFDGKNGATEAVDVHNALNEYNFARDTGEITRDTGAIGVAGTYPTIRNQYPALTLSGPSAFLPFPSGIKVEYRAGCGSNEVPYDLQMATLDTIKLIYKQDQESQDFHLKVSEAKSFHWQVTFPTY